MANAETHRNTAMRKDRQQKQRDAASLAGYQTG
jgi:hypothetical protein